MKNKIAQIGSYKTGEFKVPDHNLSFLEWNEDAEEVLVCVHSLITNSRDFEYLGNSISQNFRVIAVDMPGRGDSDYFDNPELYNYEVYIADLLALLESLKISKIHFMGSSMGGIMGMILAANAPDFIKSLILNDIGPEIPGKALAKIRKYVGIDLAMPNTEAAKQHLQVAFKDFGIEGDANWDHVTKHNTVLKEDGLLHLKYDLKIAKTFTVDYNNPEDIVFWDVWDKITSPTLLIHGVDSDILLQKTVDKMSKRHNMCVYAVHDVGHVPALYDKKEIDYIGSWLQNITQNS